MADISSTPRELTPGSDLGPYRIDGLLGAGGMGTVYRARQVHLQRVVALKVMKPALAANHDFCERFMREAITHPHVVMIFDADIRDGLLFQVFEFVPGGDLWQLIQKRGPLPPATALKLIAECADGLQAIHALGLLHRDLKPQNIFMDAAGRAKLGDFGMACQADGEDDAITATGVVMGTPAYMSPEQAKGGGTDTRSDIYSLGATLFTLLAARKPFPGANALDVVSKVVNAPTPDPREQVPSIPAAVVALVQRTMAKNPAERPTALDLMQECMALAASIPAAPGRTSSANNRAAGTGPIDPPPPTPTPATQQKAAKMASSASLRPPPSASGTADLAEKRRDPRYASSANVRPAASGTADLAEKRRDPRYASSANVRPGTAELTPPARAAMRAGGTGELPGQRTATPPAAGRPRAKTPARAARGNSTGTIATVIAVVVLIAASAVIGLALGGSKPVLTPDPPVSTTHLYHSDPTAPNPKPAPVAQAPAMPAPPTLAKAPPEPTPPVAQTPPETAPPTPAPEPTPPVQAPSAPSHPPTPSLSGPLAVANPKPVSGLDPQLIGKVFDDGGGTYANSQLTGDKAFDGDTTTIYDAATPTDSYVGIDLGAGHAATVTAIRFYARYAYTERMKGGIFEGSNDAASGYVTLATVTVSSDTAWTTVTVSGAKPYRYLRYRSPVEGNCNVAEIEFHGKK